MLRVDFQGASDCIAKMGGYIEQMKSNADQINTLMTQTLGQSWEGDSFNNCMEIYQNQYANQLTKEIPAMVEELQKYMEHCKTQLEEADRRLAGR